jgi:hypothetical protein
MPATTPIKLRPLRTRQGNYWAICVGPQRLALFPATVEGYNRAFSLLSDLRELCAMPTVLN